MINTTIITTWMQGKLSTINIKVLIVIHAILSTPIPCNVCNHNNWWPLQRFRELHPPQMFTFHSVPTLWEYPLTRVFVHTSTSWQSFKFIQTSSCDLYSEVMNIQTLPPLRGNPFIVSWTKMIHLWGSSTAWILTLGSFHILPEFFLVRTHQFLHDGFFIPIQDTSKLALLSDRRPDTVSDGRILSWANSWGFEKCSLVWGSVYFALIKKSKLTGEQNKSNPLFNREDAQWYLFSLTTDEP